MNIFTEEFIMSLSRIFFPSKIDFSEKGELLLYEENPGNIWELSTLDSAHIRIRGWILYGDRDSLYDPLEDDAFTTPTTDVASFYLAASVYREMNPKPDIYAVRELGRDANDREMAGILADTITEIKFQKSMEPLLHAYEEGELTIRTAGGFAPYQAEGTIQGHKFYFRYRNGTATLSVGSDDPVSTPFWKASIKHGEALAGSLRQREFFYLFTHLISQLSVAKRRYEFSPKENFGYPDSITPTEAAEMFLTTIRKEMGFPELPKERFMALLSGLFPNQSQGHTGVEILSCYADSEQEALDWLQRTAPLSFDRLYLSRGDTRDVPSTPIVVHQKYSFPSPI